MEVFVGKNARVVVQGVVGVEWIYHVREMIRYGTRVLGGVGCEKCINGDEDLVLYKDMFEAVSETNANVSIIFEPQARVAQAIKEAIDVGISFVVVVSKEVPLQEMVQVKQRLKGKLTRLIGPDCFGFIRPGELKLGIMPSGLFKEGKVGIISRYSSLTYDVVGRLVRMGIGQSVVVGIGAAPIIGTTIKEAVQLLMSDTQTEQIIVIGDMNGGMEQDAAYWIKENAIKPVYGVFVGEYFPVNRTMGHAEVLIKINTFVQKMNKQFFEECGVSVVDSFSELGKIISK